MLLLSHAVRSLAEHFVPADSTSFNATFVPFSTSFADGSQLFGEVVSDILKLGNFYARVEFVSINHDSHPASVRYSGILGIGIPARGHWSESVLAWLTSQHAPATDPRNPIPRLVYALLLTMHGGEMHLGGWNPDSVLRPPVFQPVLPEYCFRGGACVYRHFKLLVTALYYEGTELMASTPGVMDSGTSCLVLPWVVYEKYQHARTQGSADTLVLQFGTDRFSFDTFVDGRSCVRGPPTGDPHLLLIGDVFFRQHVVVHDLTDPAHPRLGVAPVNPEYKVLRAAGTSGILAERTQSPLVSTLPLVSDSGIRYGVQIELGTPPQKLFMTLDTGSSRLAVFTTEAWQSRDAAVVVILGLVAGISVAVYLQALVKDCRSPVDV